MQVHTLTHTRTRAHAHTHTLFEDFDEVASPTLGRHLIPGIFMALMYIIG